jgi:hypothetical protein
MEVLLLSLASATAAVPLFSFELDGERFHAEWMCSTPQWVCTTGDGTWVAEHIPTKLVVQAAIRTYTESATMPVREWDLQFDHLSTASAPSPIVCGVYTLDVTLPLSPSPTTPASPADTFMRWIRGSGDVTPCGAGGPCIPASRDDFLPWAQPLTPNTSLTVSNPPRAVVLASVYSPSPLSLSLSSHPIHPTPRCTGRPIPRHGADTLQYPTPIPRAVQAAPYQGQPSQGAHLPFWSVDASEAGGMLASYV